MSKQNKFLIDFIGIGAEKSGTSWLSKMLSQHHQIYIPRKKELHFFNQEYMHNPKLPNINYQYDLNWYHKCFNDAQPHQLKGEFSPTYMWSKTAPQKIYNYNPNIKLIAVLRNPIEKAFSLYLFYKQIGVIKDIPFSKVLEERPDFLTRGHYYKQLKRYYDLFPSKNIKVILFDDMLADKISFLQEIENFLGVEEFIPDNINERINPTRASKFPILTYMIEKSRQFLRKHESYGLLNIIRKTKLPKITKRLTRINTSPYKEKPSLDKNDKEKLQDYYRDDVKKLEGLINKDLISWLQ